MASFLVKYKNNPIAIQNIIINSFDDPISNPNLPKRNFAKADKIRDELAENDIILEDSFSGTKWGINN